MPYKFHLRGLAIFGGKKIGIDSFSGGSLKRPVKSLLSARITLLVLHKLIIIWASVKSHFVQGLVTGNSRPGFIYVNFIVEKDKKKSKLKIIVDRQRNVLSVFGNECQFFGK